MKKFNVQKALDDSERLIARIGHDAKKYKLTLSELDRNAERIMRSGGDASEQEGIRLLATAGFNAEEHMRHLNSAIFIEQVRGLHVRKEAFEELDVEGYLKRNHEYILDSAIEEAKRLAENDTYKVQKRWAADDWEEARRNFLEVLGTRNAHHGPAGVGGGVQGERFYTLLHKRILLILLSISTDNPSLILIGARGRSGGVGGGGIQIGNPPVSLTDIEAISRSRNRLLTKQDAPFAEIDPESAVTSTLQKIVKRVVRPMNKVNKADGLQPFLELRNILGEAEAKEDLAKISGQNQSKYSNRNLNAHRAVLEQLACMVGEGKGSFPTPPGSFASIASIASIASSVVPEQEQKISRLTHGSLKYFGKEFISVVENTLKKFRRQPTTDGHYLKGILESYVSLKNDRMELPGDALLIGGTVPLWPMMYYFIRIGEYNEALEIARTHSLDDVIHLLQCVCENKHVLESSISPQRSQNPSGIDRHFENCKAKLRDMCMKMQNQVPQDLYQMQVLALLVLDDRDDKEDEDDQSFYLPDEKIEDQIWKWSWKVSWHRILQKTYPMTYHKHFSEPAVTEGTIYQIVQQRGGEQDYDPDGDTPYAYVKVLLSCHRFGDAVVHLWHRKETLAAVNVAMVCLYYGLILPYGRLRGPGSFDNLSTASGADSLTAVRLMFEWSVLWRELPEYAVDFILTLNSHWYKHRPQSELREKDEAKRLFNFALHDLLTFLPCANSRTMLEKLVGKESPLGPRDLKTGHFSMYLTDSEQQQLDLILGDAGDTLVNRDRNPLSALFFYKLCGQCVDVLNVYCRQLADIILEACMNTLGGGDILGSSAKPGNLRANVQATMLPRNQHSHGLKTIAVQDHPVYYKYETESYIRLISLLNIKPCI